MKAAYKTQANQGNVILNTQKNPKKQTIKQTNKSCKHNTEAKKFNIWKYEFENVRFPDVILVALRR